MMTTTELRKARRRRSALRRWKEVALGDFFTVKLFRDNSAILTDKDIPPGRYRRYRVEEIAARDGTEALMIARDAEELEEILAEI
jgi:hypothetical protein